jgi:hypothetical protein
MLIGYDVEGIQPTLSMKRLVARATQKQLSTRPKRRMDQRNGYKLGVLDPHSRSGGSSNRSAPQKTGPLSHWRALGCQDFSLSNSLA